jgi:DNA-binding response OmpR family regulator
MTTRSEPALFRPALDAGYHICRCATSDMGVTSYGGGRLRIDEGRLGVELDGRPLALTPTEWSLLLTLVRTPGRVIPRHELVDLALGRDIVRHQHNIDAHMKNLRRKLADRGGEIVETVRGVGYRLRLARDH